MNTSALWDLGTGNCSITWGPRVYKYYLHWSIWGIGLGRQDDCVLRLHENCSHEGCSRKPRGGGPLRSVGMYGVYNAQTMLELHTSIV